MDLIRLSDDSNMQPNYITCVNVFFDRNALLH